MKKFKEILKSYTFDGQELKSLDKIPTKFNESQKELLNAHEPEELKLELSELQHRLFAGKEKSLLVVLQGMDTSGKDSLIRHVFSGFNPQGCKVHSFGPPSSSERLHDFLWRHHTLAPARGQITVFNRSYYEHVLICRVHPEFILAEKLSSVKTLKDINGKFWKTRYKHISRYEEYLQEHGTELIKIFLHISPKEQKSRLMDRLKEPQSLWKFDAGDLNERKLWQEYQECYAETISETGSKESPWYVVPGDSKKKARRFISLLLKEKLNQIDPQYPLATMQQSANLQAWIQELNDSEV